MTSSDEFPPLPTSTWIEFTTRLRIVTVAGVATGLVVIGVGSRLAMLLLRVTSSASVIGMESDDGFVIGQFSVRDTYGLVQIGALVGPIGATTYLMLRRWLLGPRWFHLVTVGLASGAVGGSMLLHADGVDFRFLGPRWLAIALFVAIPTVFGIATAAVVDRIERRGPPGWALCVAALACGPAALLSYIVVAPVTLARAALATGSPAATSTHTAFPYVVRAIWLAIAVVGAYALFGDVRAIIDLPPPPR